MFDQAEPGSSGIDDTGPDDTGLDDTGPGEARPDDTGSLAGVLDDYSSRVLDVVDAIPAGHVMSYGDIAEYLGTGGPRQVGRVLASYGGAVAWWRVIHADGTPAPGHEARALAHYLAERTPMRSFASPVRVDMSQARWKGSDAAQA
jgi:alkylated DNA nucleotide flippase Atl1